MTAVVVGKSGHTLDEAAVIAHCRERIAHFKVPKRVVFVDALPKNPSGKLLKRELRAAYGGRAEALPGAAHPAGDSALGDPQRGRHVEVVGQVPARDIHGRGAPVE